MQKALYYDLVRVEDYLEGEEASELKHEFIDGAVYAMAGATIEHNLIALNIATSLRSHLKGKPCKVVMSDVKVRLKSLDHDVFYYPDVMVGCDPRDTDRLYLRYPKLLVEVSSPSTERLDRQEKRLAYQSIETLEEYLIVAQDRIEASILRRTNNWSPDNLTDPDKVLTLQSVDLILPVSLIYEGVTLATRG